MPTPHVFVTGPTLPEDSPVYVARPEEQALFDALESGLSCALIGPPRLGKTSLVFKALKRLAQKGVRVAYFSFMTLARDGTPEAWLEGLCTRLREELDLPLPDDSAEAEGDFAARWSAFLRHEVLGVEEPVVLFLDEVNLLRGRPFAGDFFDVLARVEEAELRPTLCLVSTVAPTELVAPRKGDPFGRRVDLGDFTRAQIAGFGPHLGVPEPAPWLDAVHARTEGHPYLTQRLCAAIAEDGNAARSTPGAWLDAFIPGLYPPAPRADPLLKITDDAFRDILSPVVKLDALEIYDKLRHAARVRPRRGQEDAVLALRLVGLVTEEPERTGIQVKLRNPIFTAHFGDLWVRRERRPLQRPYTAEIDRWIKEGCKRDHLPRRKALLAALAWLDQQHELTLDEREYQLALQRELTRTQQMLSLTVIAALLVVALLVGLHAWELRKERDELTEQGQLPQTDIDTMVKGALAEHARIKERTDKGFRLHPQELLIELVNSSLRVQDQLATALQTANGGRLEQARARDQVANERDKARSDCETRVTGLTRTHKEAQDRLTGQRDGWYRKYLSTSDSLTTLTKQLEGASADRDVCRKNLQRVDPGDLRSKLAQATTRIDQLDTQIRYAGTEWGREKDAHEAAEAKVKQLDAKVKQLEDQLEKLREKPPAPAPPTRHAPPRP